MNAAEQLFAQRGFEGVSVREITSAAQVDVALVSYHFGGKGELFAALFQRRAEQLNEERAKCLSAAQQAALPGVPSVDAVIGAYVRPMQQVAMSGDPGWRCWFQIVAQVNNSPYWAPRLMSAAFDPGAARLIAALRAALPDAPAEQVFWGILFLAGALTMTFAQTGRIDRLSQGLCVSTDLKTALERLIPFATAGFYGLTREAAIDAVAIPATITKKPKLAPKRRENTRVSTHLARKRR